MEFCGCYDRVHLMSQRSTQALLVTSALLLSACGGASSRSPTSPTSPTSPGSQPRFVLAGSVTGFQGAPLAGAEVKVVDGVNKGEMVVADALGKYAFSALQSGFFAVQVSAQEYAPATKTVTLSDDAAVDFQMQAIPTDFGFVTTSVVPLSGRPAGTYGGAIVNSGNACAWRVAAIGRFLDQSSNLLTTLSWSATATTVFKPGDRVTYEFCCVTSDQAVRISNVDVALSWTNRPCA